jgi:hypothetical protein
MAPVAGKAHFSTEAAPEHVLRLLWAAQRPGAAVVLSWVLVPHEGDVAALPAPAPALVLTHTVCGPAELAAFHGAGRPGVVVDVPSVRLTLFKANAAARYGARFVHAHPAACRDDRCCCAGMWRAGRAMRRHRRPQLHGWSATRPA